MRWRWAGLGAIGLAAAGVVVAWAVFRTGVSDSRPDAPPAAAFAMGQNPAARAAGPGAGSGPIAARTPPPSADSAGAASGRSDARPGSDATRAPVTLPATEPPATPVVAAAATPLVDQTTAGVSTDPPAAAAPAPRPVGARTIVIKKDTVIGIRLDQAIAGDTARVDDKITARISRDVVVDGVTAIPAGARLEGIISQIDRSARGSRGKVGLRFTTLVRADDTRVAIQTDTIFREGEAVGEPAPAFNAGGGFGAVLANRGQTTLQNQAAGRAAPGPAGYRDAQLPAGSPLTVQLTAPISLTINRESL